MYKKFFYLNENPFNITPDPRFLYLGKKHREAIDLMRYGVSGKKGFILLTGEVGTGKTTLCRALLGRLSKSTQTALVLNPLLSDHDLLKTITEDFGLKSRSDTVKAHIDSLNGFLLKVASGNGVAAVIIDEAQNLNPKALEMLRLLSNLETEREKLLQIILVGQPELREKLNTTGLRQLNQRITVRYHLDPLGLEETRSYIRNRLFVAGGDGSVDFTDEAVKLVFKGSLGVPRVINIICERALTAAFVEGKRVVDGRTAAKAIDDLKKDGSNAAGTAGYGRYTPHIAASVFIIALMAGIFLGSQIFK